MKGKANLVCAVAVAVLAFLLQFGFVGYEKTWLNWQVPPMSPCFNDCRAILVWSDIRAQGLDPMAIPPPDPNVPTMNYPRIWSYLHLLGLNEDSTPFAGVVLISLFLAGVCVALPRVDRVTVAFVLVALISPAVLLGIERGNIDLLLFFLLSLSIVWVGNHAILALAPILLAFALKLYPIFGLGVLLRRSRSSFLSLVSVSFVLAALYALLTLDDLRVIAALTPRRPFLSFGIRVLSQGLADFGPAAERAGACLSYLVALATLLWSLRSLSRSEPGFLGETDGDSRRLDAFRMGSSVFIGTFMLGNNWDYRLMFLIFAIPQILSWTRHPSRLVSRISIATLVGMYLSMWHLVVLRILLFLRAPHALTVEFLLDEAWHYTVFCGLIYLFVLSLPEWARQYVWRLRGFAAARH